MKSKTSTKKLNGYYVRYENESYAVYDRKRKVNGDHERIIGGMTQRDASNYAWQHRFD